MNGRVLALAAVSVGVATACSGSGGHGALSGEALSCGAGMYISEGKCAPLPPFSDAGVPLGDGGASTNSGAGPTLVDPLAPCDVPGDIFSVYAVYPGGQTTTAETYTDLDAVFQTFVPPFLISVGPLNVGLETSLSFAFSPPDDAQAFVVPPLGPHATSEPGFSFTVDLDAMPAGGGTVTIDDVQFEEADGAPDRLRSLALWFVLRDSEREVAGCLRYVDPAPQSP